MVEAVVGEYQVAGFRLGVLPCGADGIQVQARRPRAPGQRLQVVRGDIHGGHHPAVRYLLSAYHQHYRKRCGAEYPDFDQ